MTAAEIVARTKITDVWAALGGGELRHGRGRAFWRDGDGWSVSLRDERGAWFDHRDGVGGGVLDLVRHVRGGTRGEALRLIAEYLGVELDGHKLTAAERRRYAQAKERVPELAQRIADFAGALRIVAERELQHAASVTAMLLELDIDPPGHAHLNHQVELLRAATPRELAALWREAALRDPVGTAELEHIGRADREDAERITWAIVSVLASGKARAA